MPSEIYQKPRHFFKVSFPLVRNEHIKRPLLVSECSIGYFGPSSATNTTWTLFAFGWAICQWQRHEWRRATEEVLTPTTQRPPSPHADEIPHP